VATAGVAAGFFRLEADVVRRSKGYSVIEAAAYRARCEITNERTGEICDYTRANNKPLFSGFYAPVNAPQWARERGSFWNHVEQFEKRKDAQLGRDIMIDLPHQMSTEHARFALQDFIRDNFVRKGYAVQLDIHPAHEYGDQRNLHAHLLVALRKIEGEDFGKKERTFNGRQPNPEIEVSVWREQAARHINRQLERFGYDLQVDHRRNDERGIDREPTIHLGKTAAAMERRGIESERGDINREIYARNAERERQKRQEIAEERHAVRELHALYGPDLKLDAPESEYVSAIERQQAEDREDRAAAIKEAEREERKAASLPQYVRELLRALRSLGRTMGAELSNLVANSDPEGLQAAARAERERALKIAQQQAGPVHQAPPPAAPQQQERETYLARSRRLAKERGDPETEIEIERSRKIERGRLLEIERLQRKDPRGPGND
jgi:hypothetical protein